MACVIAGTKKTKEQPAPKTKANNDAQPARPVPQNNISLEGAKGAKQQRPKKKCEC